MKPMTPVKSKNRKLNLQVRTNLDATKPIVETDLLAHSTELTDEDLSEVAAYSRTRTCPRQD